MKCKKCGADMFDTDKFCDQCGWKVEEKARCPECGATLREGTKFCPECGRMIGEDSADGKVYVKEAETADMPIADIEQNIVSMTEREMRISDKDKKPAQRFEYETRRPKKAVPAPEPRKTSKPAPVKKRVYEKWDDDDWEDDDEDEDDGGNFMTIVSVCTAFLILAVAAFLIFTLIRKQPERDNGEIVEDTGDGIDAEDEGQQESDAFASGQDEGTEIDETGSIQSIGTLSIISDVRVRDNPTTEGSNIIKVAKAGETYEYVGTAEDGNWYIIILEDGSTGYVFGEYVSTD